MRLRVGEVRRTSRVSTSDRTFLEMPLENVTPRKCIVTQDTRIRPITGVCSRLAEHVVSIWGSSYVTYVVGDGALDAWHGGRSCYNAGMGTFLLHLWSAQLTIWQKCCFQLGRQLDGQQRSVKSLAGPAIPRHGYEANDPAVALDRSKEDSVWSQSWKIGLKPRSCR